MLQNYTRLVKKRLSSSQDTLRTKPGHADRRTRQWFHSLSSFVKEVLMRVLRWRGVRWGSNCPLLGAGRGGGRGGGTEWGSASRPHMRLFSDILSCNSHIHIPTIPCAGCARTSCDVDNRSGGVTWRPGTPLPHYDVTRQQRHLPSRGFRGRDNNRPGKMFFLGWLKKHSSWQKEHVSFVDYRFWRFVEANTHQKRAFLSSTSDRFLFHVPSQNLIKQEMRRLRLLKRRYTNSLHTQAWKWAREVERVVSKGDYLWRGIGGQDGGEDGYHSCSIWQVRSGVTVYGRSICLLRGPILAHGGGWYTFFFVDVFGRFIRMGLLGFLIWHHTRARARTHTHARAHTHTHTHTLYSSVYETRTYKYWVRISHCMSLIALNVPSYGIKLVGFPYGVAQWNMPWKYCGKGDLFQLVHRPRRY